jgi:hypothetical protein
MRSDTVNAVDLISKIQKRANNPKRRSSASHFALERFKHDPRWSRPYPPALAEQIERTEGKLGFNLPALLARLYTEVGNGGFGPGYGLFGIEGGFTDEDTSLTMPDLYLSWAHPVPGLLDPPPWPKGLIPICDWGCNMMSCIDCSAPGESRMIFMSDGTERTPENLTFDQWMEDWVKGVDLFKRATGA